MKETAPFRAFVVGTDTGIGKTQVARALLSLLADAREKPAPFKPYETGVVPSIGPADAMALRAAARSDDDLDLICPHRFSDPLAPGVAAARLGTEPSFALTLKAFHSFDGRALIAEAAGGLRVPIDSKRDNLDLVKALGLPAILVARAGLGTLNHTALSLDALKARRIPVLAVVLVCKSMASDPSERDNPKFIAERHGVKVVGPLQYMADSVRRHLMFQRALRPLLAS